jgi:predicted nucleic acid-binding protein
MARRSRYVIADTSILIFIDRLRVMEVLKRLYHRIIVPDAVRDEVEEGLRRGRPGPDLAAFPWLEIRPVPFRATEVIGRGFGAGESAVLSLAISLRPREIFILIDDDRARELAASLGFARTGVLGVLLEAKRSGLIPLVKPYLRQLVAAGLWVSPTVLRTLLVSAGE